MKIKIYNCYDFVLFYAANLQCCSDWCKSCLELLSLVLWLVQFMILFECLIAKAESQVLFFNFSMFCLSYQLNNMSLYSQHSPISTIILLQVWRGKKLEHTNQGIGNQLSSSCLKLMSPNFCITHCNKSKLSILKIFGLKNLNLIC